MKFRITVSGGFTGIPEVFTGELDADTEIGSSLLSAVEKRPSDTRKNWPDAFTYRVWIQQGNNEWEKEYSENNVPAVLREFLDSIRDQ